MFSPLYIVNSNQSSTSSTLKHDLWLLKICLCPVLIVVIEHYNVQQKMHKTSNVF